MNSLPILIIRTWSPADILPQSGLAQSGMQMLCITLEKEGAGTIATRIIPLPEQASGYGQMIGPVLDMATACRPWCLFLDFNDTVPSFFSKALEQALKKGFPDARLVHSTDPGPIQNQNFQKQFDTNQGYRGLKAVPGIPLIELIQNFDLYALVCDAVHRMGFDQKSARNFLGRMRVDKTLSRLWEVGKNLEYHFQKPEQMPSALMDEIIEMVGAGGSVDTTHVRSNLEAAYLIGYAVEDGVIVGDSSLKYPRKAFVDRLKRMTGLDFTGCVERGYTSVRPEYRSLGIGTRLLEGLTARAHDVGIYSVIDEKNIAARKIAINNNTRKIAQYFSEKAGKHLGVWMPETMADAFLKKHQGDNAL